MTSSGYLRYPHIHGDLLVFASEDDIWLAPADGGRAWRLSADSAPVSYPRFSRDGARIAWTSWRDGNPEVYTADPDGNAAGRLTYLSDARTRVTGWTRDGEVLAVSAAGQPESYLAWAYAIPLEGAPPRRLPFGPVVDLALEETGTALLTGRMNNELAFWKRYRGGTRGKLWTASDGDPLFTRVLADVDGQLSCPMLIGGRLFFLSDHEGTGNIYSCAPDGTGLRLAHRPRRDVRQESRHRRAADRLPRGRGHLDPGLGRRARAPPARHHAGFPRRRPGPPARLREGPPGQPELRQDRPGERGRGARHGALADRTRTARPARCTSTGTPGPRLPQVLGETGQAIWVTDAAGPDALAIGSVTGEADTRTVAEGLVGNVISLTASPDGATVAAAAHDGRLLTVDVASGQVTELATSDNGLVQGLSWSPDSAWLAWTQPGPVPLRRIRMAR